MVLSSKKGSSLSIAYIYLQSPESGRIRAGEAAGGAVGDFVGHWVDEISVEDPGSELGGKIHRFMEDP